MALPSVNLRREAEIVIELKPYTLDGVIFYVAQHLNIRSGDFLSVSLHRGFLELRYNLGSSRTTVVRSLNRVSNETGKFSHMYGELFNFWGSWGFYNPL